MAKLKVLNLSDENKQELQTVIKFGADWRQRERAQMLLLLGQGKTCNEVGEMQGLSPRTVGHTRSEWLLEGMGSLADKPRCGTPKKLDEAQIARLVEWAQEEPLTAVALQAKHEETGGKKVHIVTLTRALKDKGFVWKRTRHCLGKKETKPTLIKPKRSSMP